MNNIYEETRGYLIHELLGISWPWFRTHYLIPLDLSPSEWEQLKFDGKIPWGARHPDKSLNENKNNS